MSSRKWVPVDIPGYDATQDKRWTACSTLKPRKSHAEMFEADYVKCWYCGLYIRGKAMKRPSQHFPVLCYDLEACEYRRAVRTDA